MALVPILVFWPRRWLSPPGWVSQQGDGDKLTRAGARVGDPITTLHVDAFGRLLPAPDRWPSAWNTTADAGNQPGFGPVAKKVHAMGMKFGIHIMRGISTTAVAAKTPIKGYSGSATAADIALPNELCPWCAKCGTECSVAAVCRLLSAA